VVSEKKIVEIVDARRRTTDIQVITKAHPEHSSGELKTWPPGGGAYSLIEHFKNIFL